MKYYGEPRPDYEFNVWTHPDCHGTEFENGNRFVYLGMIFIRRKRQSHGIFSNWKLKWLLYNKQFKNGLKNTPIPMFRINGFFYLQLRYLLKLDSFFEQKQI